MVTPSHTLKLALIAMCGAVFLLLFGGAAIAAAAPDTSPPATSPPSSAVPPGAPASPAQPDATATPGTGATGQQGGGDSSLYGYAKECNTAGGVLGALAKAVIPGGESLGGVANQACQATNAATHPGDAASALWDSSVGKLAQAAISSWGDGLTLMMTWWLHIPIPQEFETTAPKQLNDATYYIQVSLLALSMAIAGLRLAWARAHARAEVAEETAKMITRAAFAAWSFGPFLLLGRALGDALADYLIKQAGNTDGGTLGAVKNLLVVGPIPGLGPFLIIIMAIFGIIGALVQAVCVVMQILLLMPVIGFAPIVAAASGTKAGAQAWEKIKGWGIAFVLYKPVAASMIALALWAANGSTPMGRLLGMIMLAFSGFALFALMRLVVPAVAEVGGSGASALVAGGLAASGAVGGQAIAGMMGGGSGGGSADGGQSSSEAPTGNSSGGSSGGMGEMAMSGAAAAATGGASAAGGASGGASGAIGGSEAMGGSSSGAGGSGMAGQLGEQIGAAVQATGSAVDDTAGGGPPGNDGGAQGGRAE
ncbi:hypothetical protein [Williamsia sp.]|uniref:hypothetical protein n=1 Tax=Williamsia sp. TaxID=1872085 RepID=UPI001A1AABD0|nr:hypothetical protein [Williamsia sp.]MBJ7287563.1 hypothetical protein [Williamsia sp.]